VNRFHAMSTVVAGLMTTSISGQAVSPAERLLAQPRPLVIAHRGYSAAAPENTLPAFQLAVTAGADMVELDYHHSRDGILTVLHDSTLDRTTDAIRRWGGTNLNVSKYTFDQLRELDAATWRGSNQPPAGIPRLTDALDLIQKGSVTLIERKAGPAPDCIALLREKKLMNQVVVQAFDWEYLEAYHQLEPDQVLGALGPWNQYRGQKLTDADKNLSPRWIDEARRVGARAIVWNRQVDAAAVQDAHAKGLKVWVYTIDDPALMRQLVDTGVDGIITNNPGLAWRTFAERNPPIPGIPADWRLVVEEHFDSPTSLDRFERSDAGAWKHTADGSSFALELTRQSQYQPPVRSPVNVALLSGLKFGDFILEADLLQTGREYGHRDMCLFFGVQDRSHLMYVHIATAADEHAHNIFRVDGAPRTKVATRTTAGVKWGQNVWHKIRVERRSSTGLVRVYFDNLSDPIMEATDKTFPTGLIGFGSFDDTGKVDNLRIWAPSAPEKTTTRVF